MFVAIIEDNQHNLVLVFRSTVIEIVEAKLANYKMDHMGLFIQGWIVKE